MSYQSDYFLLDFFFFFDKEGESYLYMDWTCLLTGMRAKQGTTRAKTMKAAFMSTKQQNLVILLP